MAGEEWGGGGGVRGGCEGGGGSGVLPQKIFNLVDVISCILVHFADGHYLKYHSDS